MIPELDIHRTAKLLIDQHGEAAAVLTASEKAEKLWRQGDVEGAATWERVARAVAAMTATETDRPVH